MVEEECKKAEEGHDKATEGTCVGMELIYDE